MDVLGLQFSPGERRGSLTRRMSNGFVELKEEAKDVYHAVRPSRRMSNADVDVLGMPKTPRAGVETPRAGVPISDSSAPLPPSAPPPETPREGEPMLGASSRRDSYVATSDVLHEDENDWAAEALLLTHEPMRRDMATMNECLEVRFFGALPESWRVRAFFRFFSGWSALISQHHAVEAAVLCDYLAEPTGGLPPNYRQELLEYQRGIEVKAVAVGRMEAKILHELTQAADWTTSEPVSQCAEELRELVGELCEEVLSHLDEQEALLPPLLRAFWGQSSPPLLLVKSMEAAKASGLKGHRPQIFVKLLSWIVYYLQDRDPTRARYVVAQLPLARRLRLALRLDTGHTELLEQLRAIYRDEPPRRHRKPSAPLNPVERGDNGGVPRLHLGETSESVSSSSAATTGLDVFESRLVGRRDSARGREKHRRETRVNAVLAAANATRVTGMGDNTAMSLTRQLAAADTPMYTFGQDGIGTQWWKQHKYQSGIWKNLGKEKPSTPRRV